MANNGNGVRHRRILAALLGSTLLCGGVAIGFSASGAMAPPPISVPQPPKLPSFSPLVAAVKPAVVNISTTQTVKSSKLQLPEDSPLGDMLQQFLGPDWQKQLQQQQGHQTAHALGSGFIIDPAGYIVTNNHVIDDASDIQVTLSDGTTVTGHVVGRDSKTDIALLKIPAPHPLPYLAFGDSGKAKVGDWVIAVGNPFGLGGTVTAGIISGDNRDINAGPYDDFLQIDAPINPGNSGGPLFDESGQVIGIDTAIYSPTGGSVGIGFAIPSNVVKNVVEQLRAHGKVARGWLGVQMQEITPPLAKAIGLSNVKGVLVDLVTKDSPAAHGGVKQGDVIVGFNGAAVKDTRDLAIAVAGIPAGKPASMQIVRDGQQMTLNVTIGAEHAQQQVASNAGAQEHGGHVGLELVPLTRDRRQELGLESSGGVLVENVKPGSPADESGLQAGDVILGIGGRAVSSPDDAATRIHAAETSSRGALPLLVMRDGTTAYVALDLKGKAGTG
ncbi:MAG TPA: DegQ family serine endoprotease [Rhizomicrobium sp.]|jgi:serine protease Do|nr:DegQ family serine endoprotease [Rhizomicrobium sp.]